MSDEREAELRRVEAAVREAGDLGSREIRLLGAKLWKLRDSTSPIPDADIKITVSKINE